MNEQHSAGSTETLDPELKAKWLEALRSGQYKQGQKCLRTDDNCYCCLGVLADVMDPSKWSRHDRAWHWQAKFQEDSDDGGCWESDRTEYLPDAVAAELNFPKDVQQTLGNMNDGKKPNVCEPDIPETAPKSFAEIAAWIEANL